MSAHAMPLDRDPPDRDIALVALTDAGVALAHRLRESAQVPGIESASVHAREGSSAAADSSFKDARSHLQALYASGRSIVAICAAGIVIRSLAPVLGSKHEEPAVIALSEDGEVVVPLLGGHRGANRLARAIACALGTSAAVTTASDRRFGVALDDPPPGYTLANPQHHKAFAAALLRGERVCIEGDAPWLRSARLPVAQRARLSLSVSERAQAGSASKLVYHPGLLAVGVGCERGATVENVYELVSDSLAQARLAPAAIAGVFSLDLKADEPAIVELADRLAVPALFFEAATLEAQTPRLKRPSPIVFEAVGCHGVAEGAALAAAGEHASLVVEKTRSGRATCAIARAPEPIDVCSIPNAKPAPRVATLAVVGIGPGHPVQRTPAAAAAIAGADHLVGYSLYLDLAGALTDGKTLHPYALGEERERVRGALDLAGSGERVALICSGDPGIYAMASLVFEEMDRAGAARGRVDVRVVPGVSAMQAAAALAGAPLGHDFCAVSLSDLLTPWPVIEQRLRAACAGDFVIALYNPTSTRRRDTFEKALAIVRSQRAPATPVVVGKQLGREGESLEVIELRQLSADRVDMLSVLIVGSSETRRLGQGASARVYTPRGYGAKPHATLAERELRVRKRAFDR
ncbi:MAG: precorrin-3B C(17)-methyltransferase [Gammaproteobacteria bacterium]